MAMDFILEAGWGGQLAQWESIAWTDISTRVDLTSGVSITRGASDELSETQPGTMSLRLDNQDQALTPDNPASPFHPYVRCNVPVRGAVALTPEPPAGAGPWPLILLGDDFKDGRVDPVLWPGTYGGAAEVGGRARIPLTPGGFAGYQSAAVWRLGGSSLSARLVTLPAAGGSTAAETGMWVNSATAGTRVGWTYNPLTHSVVAQSQTGYFDPAAVSIPYSPGSHRWLRLRDTGVTTVWESSGDGHTWVIGRSAPSLAWLASDLQFVDFMGSRTGGTGDAAEWDYAGTRVHPRFHGTVNGWPIRWEGLESTAAITCTDLFKRLGRDPELRSCLTEEVLLDGPAAYYPLAEPAGSTSAGDLSGSGVGTLTRVGTTGVVAFGDVAGPAATGDTAARFTPVSATSGRMLGGDLGPAFEAASMALYNHVECWFSTSTPGRVMLALTSSEGDYQVVLSLDGSGRLVLEFVLSEGELIQVPVATGNLADGQVHHVAYDEYTTTVYVDGAALSAAGMLQALGLRRITVGGYSGTRMWDGTISHIALYTRPPGPVGPTLALHYPAGNSGFSGEPADDRIRRLVRYTGLGSPVIYGTTHDPVAGQGPGGALALARLREIEGTESGKLFAARDQVAIAYASRDVRYNPAPDTDAFTIAYADLETDQVQYRRDDQKMINTVVASRPGGATQRVTDATSIAAYGTYAPPGGDLSLLKTSDNSVLDAANWLIHRYRDPAAELREVPIEAYSHPDYAAILSADIGTHFTVTGLPAPTADIRTTVEGYTETIQLNRHAITFHTSAQVTDSVWALDDPTYSVLGTTTRLAY
ncbi:LamG domain-containing protein [Streptomyces jumonjinensis]|nr:LamG domain-containing protein [Streptomyces jumonjinensis]